VQSGPGATAPEHDERFGPCTDCPILTADHAPADAAPSALTDALPPGVAWEETGEVAAGSAADDHGPPDVPTSLRKDRGRRVLTLYSWLPSFRGDTKIQGIEAEPALSRSDVWNNLDVAFMGRFEIRPPDSDWSFWLDTFYSSLQDDDSTDTGFGPLKADLEARISFVEAAAAMHFWESEEQVTAFGSARPSAKVDLFGGIRYSRMRLQIDAEAPAAGLRAKFDEKETWWDPIVGVRVRHTVTPRLWVIVRGDVGVAGDSDSAWTATGTLQYLITERLFAGAGWKVMDLDYDRRGFEIDARMSGPFLTLSWAF
jgi:hypothetical protein